MNKFTKEELKTIKRLKKEIKQNRHLRDAIDDLHAQNPVTPEGRKRV